MFAYCNNSPVSHCDPNGYYVHTYNDKLSGLGISEGIVDAGSGGGGVPGCGGESGKRKSEIIIQREITYTAHLIKETAVDVATAAWDTYERISESKLVPLAKAVWGVVNIARGVALLAAPVPTPADDMLGVRLMQFGLFNAIHNTILLFKEE